MKTEADLGRASAAVEGGRPQHLGEIEGVVERRGVVASPLAPSSSEVLDELVGKPSGQHGHFPSPQMVGPPQPMETLLAQAHL
jgi:hypothetical protein